jgi:hypothetical protein
VVIDASGPLTVGPDGMISGTVTLGFEGLERLPPLAEALNPGSGQEVTQIVGVLNTLGGNSGSLRQVQVTLTNGQPRIGLIQLPMTIPSIFSLAAIS